MINLKSLSDSELISETKTSVDEERIATASVVRHFQELARRKLFLDYGYPNLYEMATKHFGYCAGSAMRRINSMRLINDRPSVEEQIESGELKLTVASEIQSFFYSEQKESRPYSLNAKLELIETCLGKSKREVELELRRRNPEREKRESVRPLSSERLRLSLTISDELNQKLNRLKELLSHRDPNLSTEALLDILAELGLDKHDPVRKAKRAQERKQKEAVELAETENPKRTVDDAPIPPPVEVNLGSKAETDLDSEACSPAADLGLAASVVTETMSAVHQTRYIAAEERHKLALQDDGLGCRFVSPITGLRCGQKRFIEKDHIEPFSMGGSHDARNLQLMCAAHNKYRWETRAV